MKKGRVIVIEADSKEEALKIATEALNEAFEENDKAPLAEDDALIKRGFNIMDELLEEVAENGVVLEHIFGVEPESIGKFIVDRLSYWEHKFDDYSLDDLEKMMASRIKRGERFVRFLENESKKLKRKAKKCTTSKEEK